jgi:hypothetical protein
MNTGVGIAFAFDVDVTVDVAFAESAVLSCVVSMFKLNGKCVLGIGE